MTIPSLLTSLPGLAAWLSPLAQVPRCAIDLMLALIYVAAALVYKYDHRHVHYCYFLLAVAIGIWVPP